MNVYSGLNYNKQIIQGVIREYCTLDYSDKLITLLSRASPDENFSNFSKADLHRRLNDIMLVNYEGEEVLKYELFKQFFKKNIIAAFEIRVSNSRADFLAINGTSSSFEIKSSLDNLNKLSKQASDYLLAFEYNYIVIDEKHLKNSKDLIPQSFGIWSFKNGKKKVHRPASLNTEIDSEFQLRLLTKKELKSGFSSANGNQKEILKKFSKEEINSKFKIQLKLRYQKRWHFLISHSETILPIDLQFFFNSNVDPQYIYYH